MTKLLNSLPKKKNILKHHLFIKPELYMWSPELCGFEEAMEYMSRVMRKPDFCICENKSADQLRVYHAADQNLFIPLIDSTMALLPKSDISIICQVCVGSGWKLQRQVFSSCSSYALPSNIFFSEDFSREQDKRC